VIRRRALLALLILAGVTAAVAFLTPVRAAGFDSCGVAGPWITGIGDPTGPTDPPGAYAEYNACRLAARPAVLVMSAGLLFAGLAAVLMLGRRNQRS
jgi:hypothetical protein